MKNKLCCLVAAFVAICLAAAGHAEATCYGNLDAQWNGVNPGQDVTVHAYPGTEVSPGLLTGLATTGGMYNFIYKDDLIGPPDPKETLTGLSDGDDFHTHCIDVQNYVGGRERWKVCDVIDAPDPNTLLGNVNISDAKETLLRKLYFLYPDSTITTLTDPDAKDKKASARQIAVWEIVFEHWKGLNATDTTSSFWVTDDGGAGGDANTMLSAVASYEWQYGDMMPVLYAFVDRVEGDSGDQDQLWLLEGGGEEYIPEPLTVLGMFLGLGSVGAYIRRRRMM